MPDASPFLVLELVERGSLAVLLRKGELRTTSVDWNLKVTLLHDIAKGMQFIHSLRHMHRDLKVGVFHSAARAVVPDLLLLLCLQSGNVLITAPPLHAKIADFGTLRFAGARKPVGLVSAGQSDSTSETGSLTAGVGTPVGTMAVLVTTLFPIWSLWLGLDIHQP